MSSGGRLCPNCGSRNIEQHDASGASICTECGVVVEENAIVSSVEFVEGAGGASSMVGQFVSASSSKAYSSGGGGGGRGGGRFGFSKDSRETTLANGRRRIQEVASRLRLGNQFVDAAHRLYIIAVERNFVQGRRTTHVVAACLYIACRQEKSQHMLIDFSDVLQINVYTLGTTFLKFRRLLGLKLEIIDPALYVYRFTAHLDLDAKANAVAMTALRLVARMKRDWIVAGRRPAGVCAAALLIASRAHGFERDPVDVMRILRVCGMTVANRVNEFQRTPAANLTLDEIHEKDLTEEADPPSFTKNKIIEARARAIRNNDIELLESGALDTPHITGTTPKKKKAERWRRERQKLPKLEAEFRKFYKSLKEQMSEQEVLLPSEMTLEILGDSDEEGGENENDDEEDDQDEEEKEKSGAAGENGTDGIENEAEEEGDEDKKPVADESTKVDEDDNDDGGGKPHAKTEEAAIVLSSESYEQLPNIVTQSQTDPDLQPSQPDPVDEDGDASGNDEDEDEDNDEDEDKDEDNDEDKDFDENEDENENKGNTAISKEENEESDNETKLSESREIVLAGCNKIPAKWRKAYPKGNNGKALVLPEFATPEERLPSVVPPEGKLDLKAWKEAMPPEVESEFESLFRNPEEVAAKEAIFNKINKDYIELQAVKARNTETAEKSTNDNDQELEEQGQGYERYRKRKYRSRKANGDETTEEALMQAVANRKISRKINYDAMSSIFDDDGTFSTAGAVDFDKPDEPGMVLV